MRLGCSVAAVLCLSANVPLLATTVTPESTDAQNLVCAMSATGRGAAKSASSGLARPLSTSGRLHVLVVHARFADDAPVHSTLDDALFDPQRPGSLSHYYDTMSGGQLELRGTVLSGDFVAPEPSTAYLARNAGETGRFDDFARQIMAQVDTQIDLARFDNDGPDGRPASGDDDGVVDYIFLLLPRVPHGFLVDGATGFAGLGLAPAYTTGDAGSDGEMVAINGSRYRGAILQARNFATTVGIMAHELGHGFDLPDLYDVGYDSPDTDSAGIGRWGLMGHGSTGWRGDDGPNPFSAWSLEQLGWIGDDNERLIDVTDDVLDAHLTDPRAGGRVLRIPLRTQFMAPGAVFAQEYLLLEYRGRGRHYDRHLPAEGLLVWHVRPQEGGNTNESHKLVDLICADAAAIDAIDDLDHWAHDGSFASAHGGNVGDATDPFDGRRFDRLELATSAAAASSSLAIELRAGTGNGMNLDLRLPRWSGIIDGDVEWMGRILIDGDLTVAPKGSLTIYPDTQVRVAGDRTRGGIDPRRSELRIEGGLTVSTARLTRWGRRSAATMSVGAVVLQSDVAGDTWFGVIADTTSLLDVPAGSMLIRDAQTERISRIEDVATTSAATAITAAHGSEPGGFELLPNYPNPFNPTTTIAFHLSQPQVVEIVLFDVLGQRVRRLFHGSAPAGRSDVTWDGRDDAGRSVASGLYVCMVSADNGTRMSRTMTLAR